MSCALPFILRLAQADLRDEASIVLNRTDWLGTNWLGKVMEFSFSIMGFPRYSLLGVCVVGPAQKR